MDSKIYIALISFQCRQLRGAEVKEIEKNDESTPSPDTKKYILSERHTFL